MRNKRLSTLLALLLMSGGVTMQAQEREQHSWLHYGGDEYGSNLAYSPQGIPFSWAVSFPPSVLQSYDGFTVTRVALYENYYIMGNLILGVYYGNEFMPLTLLDEQIFAPTGNEGFTDVVLDNPVELDVTKHLWIVFSETDMTETYSAAFCYSDNPSPYARWVQMEENKWEDVANYGPWERLQFMIRAYVTDDPWGVEEPITPTTVSAYPNPTNGVLNVSVRLPQCDSPTAAYRISNLMGQTVLTGSLNAETQQIDVSNLPRGMYFITVGNLTKRFVVM